MEALNGPIWHQIGRTLAEEIEGHRYEPGDRLPSSTELAERFGVNRNTVLRSIAFLKDEGLVRVERGGRMYVSQMIPYRMSARNVFEENLLQLNAVPRRELLSINQVLPPDNVCQALDLPPTESVLLVTHVGKADDVPVSIGRNYYLNSACPGAEEIFREMAETGNGLISLTGAMEKLKIVDVHKKNLRVRGRVSDASERNIFGIAPSEPVLEVEVTNVDADKRLISHAIASFPTSRVEFMVDFD